MTYSPIIPQGPPSPKNQVLSVQTNFSQFASIFSTVSGGVTYNHTALNDPNEGDHESILMTLQSVDPLVDQNLDVLYSKNASSNLGTQPQLFLRIPEFLPTSLDPSSPGNPPIQLTYNSVNTSGPVYQSFLPGGYLFYWGTDSGTTIKNVPISDTITLSPVPTKLLIAIAIPNTLTSGGTPIPFDVSTQILTSSTFTINSTGNGNGNPISYTFTWMAIASV